MFRLVFICAMTQIKASVLLLCRSVHELHVSFLRMVFTIFFLH